MSRGTRSDIQCSAVTRRRRGIRQSRKKVALDWAKRGAIMLQKLENLFTHNQVPFRLGIEDAGALDLCFAFAITRLGPSLSLQFFLLLLLEIQLCARPTVVGRTNEPDRLLFRWRCQARGSPFYGRGGLASWSIDAAVQRIAFVTRTGVFAGVVLNFHILHRKTSRMEEEATVGLGAAKHFVVIHSIVLADRAPVTRLDAIRTVEGLRLVREGGESDARVVEHPSTLPVADQECVGLGLDEALRLLALRADPHRVEFFFSGLLASTLARRLVRASAVGRVGCTRCAGRRASRSFIHEAEMVVMTCFPSALP
jgi:hypothetical protein